MTTTFKRVWELHTKGYAPSQIARKLNIEPEEAHDLIVQKWAEDKKQEALKKRLLKW